MTIIRASPAGIPDLLGRRSAALAAPPRLGSSAGRAAAYPANHPPPLRRNGEPRSTHTATNPGHQDHTPYLEPLIGFTGPDFR